MKRKTALVFILFIFIASFGAEKTKIKDLAPRFQKWLKEEVVYIITNRERDVFLELNTDRERDLFIEAFWKQRDPTPGTPENEFKTEHYRRVNYANHFFGRRAPREGWRTDRGRVYIILGEPNDIQRFDGSASVYSSEIWFYQGKTDVGLPSGFSLVFFQEGNVGEHRLYSPLRDGPMALMPVYQGDPKDYLQAYQQLRELEPELARVSLSLVAGESESFLGRPSLGSERLLGDIETVPQKMVEDRYAQKFLLYKDIVEVEYTANYMDSDSLVKILRDESGIHFVHYLIELPRLSVNQYEDTYSTHLKINGTVSDEEGGTIYQFEKIAQISFDAEQMRSLSLKPLNLHDMFPLIPGNYSLSVLVKNEVSKEFTSMERKLTIPDEGGADLRMSALLLGYQSERREMVEKRPKPFLIGPFQVSLQPNRVFLRTETLAVAFQIFGLNQDLKEKGEIRYVFLKDEEEVHIVSRKILDYPESPNFLERFSLQDFFPAHYRVRVSLLIDGQEVVSQRDEFDITHLAGIPRPWTHSRILPPLSDPFYDLILGSQFFNAGEKEKARPHLELAYQKKKDDVGYALELARFYNSLAEYTRIESLLLPFIAQTQAGYDAYFILGTAYKNLGQWSKAITTYDQAIARFGLNTSLLNAVGECYFGLQDWAEALKAWEKSLELNADQPQIKQKVEDLKKK